MHCSSVCALLVAFGNSLGLQGAELKSVGMGGLLHDIGKSLVALEILNKPGQLTEVEFTAMKRHSDLGHTLLLANRVSTIGVIPAARAVPVGGPRDLRALILEFRQTPWPDRSGLPMGTGGAMKTQACGPQGRSLTRALR